MTTRVHCGDTADDIKGRLLERFCFSWAPMPASPAAPPPRRVSFQSIGSAHTSRDHGAERRTSRASGGSSDSDWIEEQLFTRGTIPHTQEERDTLEAELGVIRARVATMYDPRVITPSNKYLAQWDVATITALVFTAVVLPVEVAFVRAGDTSFVSSPLALLNRLVEVIFIIDIGVQFHLAYFNELGKLIRSRPTISRHYLHGWFSVDLLSVLPFDLLSTQLESGGALRELKVPRVHTRHLPLSRARPSIGVRLLSS